MIARKCTRSDLVQALESINKKYKGNICFNRDDFPNFTLKVKDSHGPGHRRGFAFPPSRPKGRRMVSACWHVHGDFFDALFEVNPNAYVLSNWSAGKIKITKDSGNWQDANIGSQMYPLYFSEACDCLEEGLL